MEKYVQILVSASSKVINIANFRKYVGQLSHFLFYFNFELSARSSSHFLAFYLFDNNVSILNLWTNILSLEFADFFCKIISIIYLVFFDSEATFYKVTTGSANEIYYSQIQRTRMIAIYFENLLVIIEKPAFFYWKNDFK